MTINYKCCFCRYFQLFGYRWGHCEILNVEVKGNCSACSIAEPFFSLYHSSERYARCQNEDKKVGRVVELGSDKHSDTEPRK